MTELLFWGCVLFVAYAYFGYAVVLFLLVKLRNRAIRRRDVTPTVTLIVTVRNEEKRIADKIEQSLELDYPKDRFELIVASDCSTDDTHAIVAHHKHRGVRLVVASERHGKEFAQKLAIAASTGEILVFSDVATRLDRDGLRHIVRNFADPTVGCVTSVDRLISPSGEVSGEGFYVRYEMLLRSLESSVGSVVGLSGSLFAARRHVCNPWAVDLPSDFTTLFNSLRHGLRGISDPASVGYYPDLADKTKEYRRKVRTITRGISSLCRNLSLLNPFRYGIFAWQIFSHKVCRWLVPFALIGILLTNVALSAESGVYAAFLLMQSAMYIVAARGFRHPERLSVGPRTVTFFVLANVSILHAWMNVLCGRKFVTWEPSQRPDLAR
jgi:glycosyltransferase involved in cell wall biosynthesis